MFGLSQITIDSINAIFVNYQSILKVIVYGSRAKGNYKEGSDIDLALFGNGLDFKVISEIDCKIDDLMLPYKIDLCIYNHLENSDLKDHINKVGRLFFEK